MADASTGHKMSVFNCYGNTINTMTNNNKVYINREMKLTSTHLYKTTVNYLG